MRDPIITIEHLSKRYVIRHRSARADGFRHVLDAAVRAPLKWLRSRHEEKKAHSEEFWALNDVSLEVKQGETLGIIGRNGAGKSTLLKILSRITEPTSGRIYLKGRLASLLEVGTGFHAELTGRENIFLNGAILGMTRSEIKNKFDQIVAFAGVGKFLDTPVKRYSSGMYVRLAFAVAAHLEPEILLVDEVLAVGDAAFQAKCLAKMGDVAKEGRTILFVSHNMAAVSALCAKGMLIDNGRVATSGPTQAVIQAYLNQTHDNATIPVSQRKDRKGAGRVRFRNVSILNEHLEAVGSVVSGQNITISLEYRIRDSEIVNNVVVQAKFFGSLGQPLFACLSKSSRQGPLELSPATRLLCKIPRLPLQPGVYSFSIWCTVGENLEDYVADAAKLTVVEGDYFGTGKLPPGNIGDFIVAHDWTVAPSRAAASDFQRETERERPGVMVRQ